MYGNYDAQGLTMLGFITHDPSCVKSGPPRYVPSDGASETVTENQSSAKKTEEAEEEEASGGTGIIIGAVVGVLVLAGLAVVGVMFWRRRRLKRMTAVGSNLELMKTTVPEARKLSDAIELDHAGERKPMEIIRQGDGDVTDDRLVDRGDPGSRQSRRELLTQDS